MSRERCTGRVRSGRPCSRYASQGDRCLDHLPKADEYGLELEHRTAEESDVDGSSPRS